MVLPGNPVFQECTRAIFLRVRYERLHVRVYAYITFSTIRTIWVPSYFLVRKGRGKDKSCWFSLLLLPNKRERERERCETWEWKVVVAIAAAENVCLQRRIWRRRRGSDEDERKKNLGVSLWGTIGKTHIETRSKTHTDVRYTYITCNE